MSYVFSRRCLTLSRGCSIHDYPTQRVSTCYHQLSCRRILTPGEQRRRLNSRKQATSREEYNAAVLGRQAITRATRLATIERWNLPQVSTTASRLTYFTAYF